MDYRNFILERKAIQLKNGNLIPEINFDNASTTPVFNTVMDKINDFMHIYCCIDGGQSQREKDAMHLFEEARTGILNFVKGDKNKDVVIFMKNATEAINKLSYRLLEPERKDVVLTTEMEHYSNILPWREKYTVDYIAVDNQGKLSLEDLEAKLLKYNGAVKLVTVCGVSNITGYINPIYKIAEIAHKYKAQIHVDGAQYIPHLPVDMKPSDSAQHIDYFTFSSHKMYAPFGAGILIGPRALFEKGIPEYTGDRAVKYMSFDSVIWADPPLKEEAGTPNIIGVIALAEAIKTLTELGMENVQKYESELLQYALQRLRQIQDLHLYIDSAAFGIGIIPFNFKGIPHYILSRILADEAGIITRNGEMNATVYVNKLLTAYPDATQNYIAGITSPSPGVVRTSFALYNTKEEIDVFIGLLLKISKDKKLYVEKYKSSQN